MESLTILSPAKVNLYLKVMHKRRDGFHDIVSVMERISFCDCLKITVTKRKGLSFKCNWSYLENDNNLVIRAFRLLRKEIRPSFPGGIKISLRKQIPVGSGLGGASSNAASVLLGLNRLLNLGLSRKKMFLLGARLGSDVNFFISQARFALVRGRGEEVFPIATTFRFSQCLILIPEPISTARIYHSFSQKVRLTNSLDNAKLITFALKQKDIFLLKRLLFNNLTPMAIEASARLRKVYSLLNQSEGDFVLSGSGSSLVFLPGAADAGLKETIGKIEGLRLKKVTTF